MASPRKSVSFYTDNNGQIIPDVQDFEPAKCCASGASGEDEDRYVVIGSHIFADDNEVCNCSKEARTIDKK